MSADDDDLKIEKYQDFLEFDWNHEDWKQYLEGLYPVPRGRQLMKFRKKWYKRHVDADFDETWEPPDENEPQGDGGSAPSGGGDYYYGSGPSASSSSSGAASASGGGGGAGAGLGKGKSGEEEAMTLQDLLTGPYADGTVWKTMRQKATLCLLSYAVSLVLAIASFARAFPPGQAMLALNFCFFLELLAKYGLNLKSDYVQKLLVDEVGVMPLMGFTLILPGGAEYIRILSVVPFFLTAALSLGQLSENHPTAPPWVRETFGPLANSVARYRIREYRAHAELLLLFVLTVGIFTGAAAPFAILLYANFMVMRHMMSPWTQNSCRQLDKALDPICGQFPGLKILYPWAKKKLYSFVDPEARKNSSFCTIL